MKTLLAWMDSEPVITRIGPIITLIVGYLFVRGAIDRDTLDFITAIATLLLGSGGIVGARKLVTPTIKLPEQSGDASSGRPAE